MKFSLTFQIIVICCSLFWYFREAPAQPRNAAKNGIYFELLGNGFLYSINYERAFNQFLLGRIGFMSGKVASEVICSQIYCAENEEDLLNIVPVMLNYLYGSGKHKFEVGVGLAFTPSTRGEFDLDDAGLINEKTKIVGVATMGYRLQPESRGVLFRVGFTPFFGDAGVQPWGGLSVGYVW